MPKRDFPPEHQHLSRLAFYALHENSIEINSSFYKLPQAKTITAWSLQVPGDFRFTFKLWKEITHQKNLLFKTEAIGRFMQAIELPRGHKGCLLVQFPPSLQVTAEQQLGELLQALDGFTWPVAVEFRHPSWHRESVFELLNRYQAALVLQDMPKAPSPFELTSDSHAYLRFHGPQGNYKGSYSDDFLYEYAYYIHDWLQEGRTVYAYFNNTAGAALANLHFLKRALDQIASG
ncbi:MAG: DUF72 domain-containing protein [Bacteroidetes bacterium]|nr:DUF72 domain-containing protein [Bacteroidota bacterium]